MTMHSVTVRHNFETGHRLPHLEGKCRSLHGHSWWAAITVGAESLGRNGIVVEYGALKAALRGWIDRHLDHGLMLGVADPLCDVLAQHGKVFPFGAMEVPGLENTLLSTIMCADLAWPTVENVATLLARVTDTALSTVGGLAAVDGARCLRVEVRETHVNGATWERP